MMKKLVQKEIASEGEVKEIYFDVTLIVTKENKVMIVDNTQENVNDYIDCGTLTSQKVKIQVC